MIQHVRLCVRQRCGPPARRSYGAVAASLACAVVVSGLSTATLVLALAIAQAT